MEPPNHPARKEHSRKHLPHRKRPKQFKLPVRATLVLLLALYASLASAGLMYAAHEVLPLIVMGAAGVFVTAYGFVDGKIE
jgi:hypothetical protein